MSLLCYTDGMDIPAGFCQCGCGGKVRPTSRFMKGHFRRGLCKIPDSERFWSKVDKSGGPDACWPWTGALFKNGYAQIVIDYKKVRVNRAALMFSGVDIPPGHEVCHKCDNPPCCNPAHLFVGTRKDNAADMVAKHRQAVGEKHGRSHLTRAQVDAIRELHAGGGWTHGKLARLFGVSAPNTCMIVNRNSWTAD